MRNVEQMGNAALRRELIALIVISLSLVQVACAKRPTPKPEKPEGATPHTDQAIGLEPDSRVWVGIGWHTLAVFGDALAEPALRRLPETDDTFAPVFDFAVTPDGRIWYPLSRFDMTGNKLVRINPLDPEEPSLVIGLGDKAPSPFNVLADERWLYVLSKYSLTESELMRILLTNTSVREKLTLPADGGGWGSVMALAHWDGKTFLGIRLFEAFALLDLSQFRLTNVLSESRLISQIDFSPYFNAFVTLPLGPERAFAFSHRANAHELEERRESDLGIIPIELPLRLESFSIDLPPAKFLYPHGDFPPTGAFDLNEKGNLAVCLVGLDDKLGVLNLESHSWTAIHELPQRVLGNVVNLGDDRFAIGGNIVYELKNDKVIIPEATLITSCTQIKPLPITRGKS